MTPDLFWIPGPWRGRLAVMTRPRGGEWLEDEVKGWHRAGLDIIVSLLESDEAAELGLAKEGSIAESGGIQFRSFPIPDRGVPASTADVHGFLSSVIRVLEGGKAVGIHCRQGIGRSGMIAAALLVTSGLNSSQALD